MLALVRRHECWHPSRELDKWCSTDLFLTQVPTGFRSGSGVLSPKPSQVVLTCAFIRPVS